MNGVHDLGGVHGFGPIVAEPEATEPVFHGDWEAAVLTSMYTTLSLGHWSLDEFRSTIERSAPVDYLSRRYYEKWLAALEELVVAHGLLTADEIAAGVAEAGREPTPPAVPWEPSFDAPATAPRYVEGQVVRAANRHPWRHTRQPRYLRGRLGTVLRHVGGEPLPEDASVGVCTPEHLYLVRFEAAELWGPDAGGRDAVLLELWETYLEPVP